MRWQSILFLVLMASIAGARELDEPSKLHGLGKRSDAGGLSAGPLLAWTRSWQGMPSRILLGQQGNAAGQSEKAITSSPDATRQIEDDSQGTTSTPVANLAPATVTPVSTEVSLADEDNESDIDITNSTSTPTSSLTLAATPSTTPAEDPGGEQINGTALVPDLHTPSPSTTQSEQPEPRDSLDNDTEDLPGAAMNGTFARNATSGSATPSPVAPFSATGANELNLTSHPTPIVTSLEIMESPTSIPTAPPTTPKPNDVDTPIATSVETAHNTLVPTATPVTTEAPSSQPPSSPTPTTTTHTPTPQLTAEDSSQASSAPTPMMTVAPTPVNSADARDESPTTATHTPTPPLAEEGSSQPPSTTPTPMMTVAPTPLNNADAKDESPTTATHTPTPPLADEGSSQPFSTPTPMMTVAPTPLNNADARDESPTTATHTPTPPLADEGSSQPFSTPTPMMTVAPTPLNNADARDESHKSTTVPSTTPAAASAPPVPPVSPVWSPPFPAPPQMSTPSPVAPPSPVLAVPGPLYSPTPFVSNPSEELGRGANKELVEDLSSTIAGGVVFTCILMVVLYQCCKGKDSGNQHDASRKRELDLVNLASHHLPGDRQYLRRSIDVHDVERQPLASWTNWDADRDGNDWESFDDLGDDAFPSPPLSVDNGSTPREQRSNCHRSTSRSPAQDIPQQHNTDSRSKSAVQSAELRAETPSPYRKPPPEWDDDW